MTTLEELPGKIEEANAKYPHLEIVTINPDYRLGVGSRGDGIQCNIAGLIAYIIVQGGEHQLFNDIIKKFLPQIKDYDFQSLEEILKLMKAFRSNEDDLNCAEKGEFFKIVLAKVKEKQFLKKRLGDARLFEIESTLQNHAMYTVSRKHTPEVEIVFKHGGRTVCSVKQPENMDVFWNIHHVKIYNTLSCEKLFPEIYTIE